VVVAKINVWVVILISPPLSLKVIKNLGEQFCKVAPENLTDAALKSSKVVKKAVMKQVKGVGKKTADTKKADATSNKHLSNDDKKPKSAK
jgi:hypothetical protein